MQRNTILIVLAVLLMGGGLVWAFTAARPAVAPEPEQEVELLDAMQRTEGRQMDDAMMEKSAEDGMVEDAMFDEAMSDDMSLNYTLDELSAHDSPDDCWISISGMVYDLSNFADLHPGGAEAIEANCGQDGTEDFLERNGFGPHPEKALEMLEELKLGSLSVE